MDGPGDESGDDSDGSGLLLGDVGFLFESSTKASPVFYEFGTARAELTAIDDDPGAVQSGHYVWPAAPALCRYLVREASAGGEGRGALSVVELGCGCGLCGLVVAQISPDDLVAFVESQSGITGGGADGGVEGGAPSSSGAISLTFTDHDHTVLERCRTNRDATSHLLESAGPVTSHITAALEGAMFHLLRWGGAGAAGVAAQPTEPVLVLGSDLIYCREVVRPLFGTVAGLLLGGAAARSNGDTTPRASPAIMVMAQSFAYDDETEDEIDACCREMGLERRTVAEGGDGNPASGDADGGGNVKIQIFRPVVPL